MSGTSFKVKLTWMKSSSSSNSFLVRLSDLTFFEYSLRAFTALMIYFLCSVSLSFASIFLVALANSFAWSFFYLIVAFSESSPTSSVFADRLGLSYEGEGAAIACLGLEESLFFLPIFNNKRIRINF